MESVTKALKLIAEARERVAFYNLQHETVELDKVVELLSLAIDLIVVK